MKIERISENQIKCTLNRSDLASRQIKISELAYGTEKTRGLFQDMMAQAENEVGFEARDLPLMIEAIPVSMDCIILMITKVEDPDELDPKFSDFTKINNPADDESNHDDLSYLLNDKSFRELLEEVDAQVQKQVNPRTLGNGKKMAVPAAPPTKVFSFATLDDVIEYARHTGSDYFGENSLFKCRDNGRYYLQLIKSSKNAKAFETASVSALEYGSKENVSYARNAYYKEHFDMIIEGNAIQSLANV